MALPGHSPPPYAGPGSPSRGINGHPDHPLPPPPPPPSAYGLPRQMLPPSPQHFQPRFNTPSAPSFSPAVHEQKARPPPPPPQKRPGSSMSISSMLGGDLERPMHDTYSNHHSHPSSRQGSISAPSMALGAVMSPPQQPARPGPAEYSYQPRSQTPDRMHSAFTGTRQRSASSGTAPTPHRPFYEPFDRANHAPMNHYAPSPSANSSYPPIGSQREEHEERTRRTSLSGILQRPSSQPQPGHPSAQPLPPYPAPTFIPPSHPLSHSSQPQEAPRLNGFSQSYDTRPPGFGDPPRPMPANQLSPTHQGAHSMSPELRRANMNGNQNRGLMGILNGPTSQPGEHNGGGAAPNMARQDSTQSQGERSAFGDRGRFRHYSPFAGAASQNGLPSGIDEQGRKGSDEAAHRTIVGLGLDNRRGRFSPVPQAVQGAQAQTSVPDSGVKSEHGRVFSGIGSGMTVLSTNPNPIPGPLPASPFKKDETMARLNDDPVKMSRTASGVGKRMRKAVDDDGRPDAEQLDSRKVSGKGAKRAKHQNSYKADLEEMTNATQQRHATPLNNYGSTRRLSPTNGNPTSITQRYDTAPIFKPKKTVKVATVMSSVVRKPRRHLGNFTYDPQVLVPESASPGDPEFDVLVKPKLLPAFSESDDLNCTYSVRISKTWLQDTERRIICSTRNLWGTGIYSDDSDPLAAAMHMGWLKPHFNDGVDEALLARVVDEQNPQVDVAKEFKPPTRPLDIPKAQDLKITLVVMPQLERYEESVRFGLRSRSWPEGAEKVPHDGVSFAILKVEFIDLGPEERKLGRSGESKRARLQAELHARLRAAKTEKELFARIKKRQAEKRRQTQKEASNMGPEQNNTGVGHQPAESFVDVPKHADLLKTSDQEEWRNQLATAAA